MIYKEVSKRDFFWWWRLLAHWEAVVTDVFISYARPDRSYVEVLERALAQAGLTSWWDRSLTPGREYDEELESTLRAAKCVIVIWSEHAVKSAYVKDEARLARDLSKLLPVRVPDFDIGRIPLGFGGVQTLLVTDRIGILGHASALAGRPWTRPRQPAIARAVQGVRHLYYAHRWPIVAVAGFLVAAGLAAFVYDRETRKHCEGVAVDSLRTTMWGNVKEGLLDNAQSQAEQLLRCDPAIVTGLSGMGTIAFYRGEFRTSADWFRKALQQRPGHFVLSLNLADALTESGEFDEALRLLESLPRDKDSVCYRLGRTSLFAGRLENAVGSLRYVSKMFGEESAPGKSLILLAAAQVQLAAIASDDFERNRWLAEAKASLIEGVSHSPDYWRPLLGGATRNPKEPFERVRTLLTGKALEWIK